jgi:hypothetical protein
MGFLKYIFESTLHKGDNTNTNTNTTTTTTNTNTTTTNNNNPKYSTIWRGPHVRKIVTFVIPMAKLTAKNKRVFYMRIILIIIMVMMMVMMMIK